MANKLQTASSRWRVGAAILFVGGVVAGCSGGDDNSPSMGAVPPKPNPNMNAKLPESIRDQLSKAKPGQDAGQMSETKRRAPKS